jgi:uncharacterized membrane protein
MKAKIVMAVLLAAASSAAMAGEYSCTAYCVSGSGSIEKTQVTISADSKSDAAQKVDNQADRICRDAGYKRATSSDMSSSQCSKN